MRAGPVSGSGAPRYLDPEAAPLKLRCQIEYSERRRRGEEPGGDVQHTTTSVRWRDRDWRALDDRADPRFTPGDLIVAITKPEAIAGTLQTDAIRMYIEDPRPAVHGMRGPVEWRAKLTDRAPALRV